MRRIRYHYHRPGRGETVFDEALVLERADMKVTLLERYEGRDVTAGADLILEPGAPIVWFVFPGAWHDVGRFHRADGSFTGWYTNLCTPVEFFGDEWNCTDLFLDYWQAADGTAGRWLDEAEFRDARARGLIGEEVADRALEEQEAVSTRVDLGGWPPHATRELDLARVREILEAK